MSNFITPVSYTHLLGVIQLCESLFQLFSGSFHLFDGEILCTFPFQRCNLVDYIIDLLLKVRSLPLGGQGNPFKLAVADYDNIVIAGGDASAEAFAVCALKVASLGHQNIGVGIEPVSYTHLDVYKRQRPGGGEGLPNRKRIGEIGGGTVLHIGRCGGCIPAGLQDVQFFRAVLDVFAVPPMTAASGKNQAGGIAGKHRTGIHVAAVGTHQLVHVPVAGVGNPAVQGVIPGGGVVRVDTGFIQIGAEGIVVGTRVCVQGIVAVSYTHLDVYKRQA